MTHTTHKCTYTHLGLGLDYSFLLLCVDTYSGAMLPMQMPTQMPTSVRLCAYVRVCVCVLPGIE